ncbi:MAG: hypothetical protein WCP87_03580, partial [Atribacterota bacterium]
MSLEFLINQPMHEKSVFISSGEISGDFYAGEFIEHLRDHAHLRIFALGGEKCIQKKATLLYDTTSIATVGLWEVLATLRQWRTVWQLSTRCILDHRPSVVIAIDNPGFNLRLIRFCRKQGIPVIYFIPPQVWVWKKKRARILAKEVDWILTIFSWEGDYFSRWGGRVKWVGHPILSRFATGGFFTNTSPRNVIVHLPGSLLQEI